MKERPILFSGEMVRALLDGRKSQTRRVIKDYTIKRISNRHEFATSGPHQLSMKETPGYAYVELESGALVGLPCPYGQPGDRLYVRHSADLFPVYFKPIHGWDGLYSAGTDGLIYRMDRGEPSPLAGSPTSKGYLTVSLSRGKWETHSVHKLVCETFYGPAPFDGAQVRHMDGNQTNNRPENLDWGTQEDNWADRRVHGRGMGSAHHSAKLTPAMVEAIRASKASQRALATQYGVSQSTIQEVCAGKTWGSHVPGKRNLPAFKMWKPSIHMPRWASRILLEITNVRVERVQEIGEEDTYAEGCERISEFQAFGADRAGRDKLARFGFKRLWDSINAARGYGWEVNPWVWVIEFRRVS